MAAPLALEPLLRVRALAYGEDFAQRGTRPRSAEKRGIDLRAGSDQAFELFERWPERDQPRQRDVQSFALGRDREQALAAELRAGRQRVPVKWLPVLAPAEHDRREEPAEPSLPRQLGRGLALTQLGSESFERRAHRVGGVSAGGAIPLQLLAAELTTELLQDRRRLLEPVPLEPWIRLRRVAELLPALLSLDSRALDVLVEDSSGIGVQDDGVRRRRGRRVDRPPTPAEQPAHVRWAGGDESPARRLEREPALTGGFLAHASVAAPLTIIDIDRSGWSRAIAAWISPRCENACGKFPISSPEWGSISSASRPTSLLKPSSRSNSSRARSPSSARARHSTSQKEQIANVASSPESPSTPSVT